MSHLIVSFARWRAKVGGNVPEKGVVVTWDSSDTSARYAKAIIVCDSDRAIVAVAINELKGEGWRNMIDPMGGA